MHTRWPKGEEGKLCRSVGAKSVVFVHSHSLQRWSPSISSLQVHTDVLTHLVTITRLNLFLLHLNLGWLFDLLWPKKCGSSDAVLILGLAFKSLAASAFPLEASFHKRSPGNRDTLRPPCCGWPWGHHVELATSGGQIEEQRSSRYVSDTLELPAQFSWMSDLKWCPQKAEEQPSWSHSPLRIMGNNHFSRISAPRKQRFLLVLLITAINPELKTVFGMKSSFIKSFLNTFSKTQSLRSGWFQADVWRTASPTGNRWHCRPALLDKRESQG